MSLKGEMHVQDSRGDNGVWLSIAGLPHYKFGHTSGLRWLLGIRCTTVTISNDHYPNNVIH